MSSETKKRRADSTDTYCGETTNNSMFTPFDMCDPSIGEFCSAFIQQGLYDFTTLDTRSQWNYHAVNSQIQKVLQKIPAIMYPGSLSKVQVDCIEYSDYFAAYVDIPGVPKESLDISIEEPYLFIQGSRNLEYGENADYLHQERFNGPFMVCIPINSHVIDLNTVKASLENGILTVVFNKKNDKESKSSRTVEFIDSSSLNKTLSNNSSSNSSRTNNTFITGPSFKTQTIFSNSNTPVVTHINDNNSMNTNKDTSATSEKKSEEQMHISPSISTDSSIHITLHSNSSPQD
ncbi:hypothetical protein WA158_004950 [Blastocystis sp. Blastoise]